MARDSGDVIELIKKNKSLVGLGIALVLLLIVVKPTITKLQERTVASNKLKSQINKLETKLEVLEGIDDNQIMERVEKMEEVFPSKKPVVQLMSSLSQLAGQNHLIFGGITLRPGLLGDEAEITKNKKSKKIDQPENLADLKFAFQIEGYYDDISAFMHDLENVAPLMKIESVNLSVKSNPLFETSDLLVAANIEVTAYYQPPPKSLGAVTTTVPLLSKRDEVLLNRLFSFKLFTRVTPTVPTGKSDLFGLGELL